jgi:hypothetical protein
LNYKVAYPIQNVNIKDFFQELTCSIDIFYKNKVLLSCNKVKKFQYLDIYTVENVDISIFLKLEAVFVYDMLTLYLDAL